MNTSIITSPTENPKAERRRSGKWRYALICLGALVLTLVLFYAEEDWRGKRAWEKCKRELAAKGEVLDWEALIPPPVPDDQNFFKAPKMQEWFVGRGPTELSTNLSTAYTATNPPFVVAEVTVVPRASKPPVADGTMILDENDPALTNQFSAVIESTISPALASCMSTGPFENWILGAPLDRIKAAKITLLSDNKPAVKVVAKCLPEHLFRGRNVLSVQAMGSNSFQIKLEGMLGTDLFLARTDQFEPDMRAIRAALQRPYARMEGDYNFPTESPIPNFVSVRTTVQMLADRARCHLLLDQSDKALEDLTLMHQLCRLLECRPTSKPMTLVAAMINVAVTGLYVSVIEDGIRLGKWQTPQLAVLEEQLKEINLAPYVVAGVEFERQTFCRWCELGLQIGPFWSDSEIMRVTDASWDPKFAPKFYGSFRIIPRGWVFQAEAIDAQLVQKWVEVFEPAGQLVIPHKLDELNNAVDATLAGRAPYLYLVRMGTTSFVRAFTSTSKNQTLARQALIVCALERYRLAHAQYPETLDALTPQFLDKIPRDIIGGQPPHYRRTADGKFLLYSIGWTEKDHGGVTGKTDSDGDWVWPQDVK
jgi:hypothetical protein